MKKIPITLSILFLCLAIASISITLIVKKWQYYNAYGFDIKFGLWEAYQYVSQSENKCYSSWNRNEGNFKIL